MKPVLPAWLDDFDDKSFTTLKPVPYSLNIIVLVIFSINKIILSICCILTSDPAKTMPFKRRRKCIFHWRGWAWLTIWDRVKIPRYSHRLMHRKRVTCELHDSYFRVMTIKYAIPKSVEVTHSDGQLWGDIEWAIELLYNSVKTGSQSIWSSESLETRCGRESQHPAESWAPGPPVVQPWRTGKRRWWP